MKKRLNPYYVLLAILILVYIAFVIVTPPDRSTLTHFSISATTARILSSIVLLPYFAIWFAAFYGFIKVKDYAKLIHKSRDGRGLSLIGDGLMVIAVSMPLTALADGLRSYAVAQDSSLQSMTTIIYNYLALGFVLVGFYFVNKGAKVLVGTISERRSGWRAKLFWLAFAVFSGIYGYVTMTNPAREHATAASSSAAYYLPDWLLFATIVAPYILVWFCGFHAASRMQLYRQKTKGVLYKQALGNLSSGIVGIVAALILLRVIISLSTFLNSLTLRVLLLVIYVLLIAMAIGFSLVARGAKRLKKIEEI